MPPVNRKSPTPRPRRRPAVAGMRATGADQASAVATSERPAYDEAPAATASPATKRSVWRNRRRDPAAPAEGNDADSPDKDVRATSRPQWLAAARRSPALAVCLLVASLMLVAAVVLAAVAWAHSESPQAAANGGDNVALLDAPATQQVGAAAIDALQKAYSYTYTSVDADLNGAVAVMTPEMAAKHRASFDAIRATATQAKTTTKATVVSDAVRLLSGDRAEVIAFVVVTGDNGGTALQPSGYRFTANMLKNNGRWLLSGLTEA